ncbi:MAG TPA: enoyl-CoA hydratase/isomerase family protein [Pyrinomonadaceae bacterium]|jgi:enoyl-CoA hydratase|nr:enoyl-CoA hydratase/isomerase family protein [Pyrinomonadaceae bacterium]
MIDDDSPPTITEVTGTVAVVRLNRPAERNPLSIATLQDLSRTTSRLFSRADIQTVIFTGTDDVFASGANIRELSQLDTEAALRFSKFGQELFQTIAEARPLTIAAINGYCMGGGLDFALACDIRVASESAVFSHPGARLGIVTGWGGTQRLPRVIGRARALEFFATARRYSSHEALELGLVSHISDPVISQALKLYGKLEGKLAG